MAAGFGTRFHSARVRPFMSKLSRLPLASRALLFIICVTSIAGLMSEGIRSWLTLTPSLISIRNLRPLSTYPFAHKTILHLLLNVAPLIPLLDRFETEFGTLITVILFTGPFATAPGALYTLTQRFIFHSNVPVLGSSAWVFLLLAAEARKTSQATPSFNIGSIKVPTWALPLALIIFTYVMVPGSSLTGHIFGAAVGYSWSVARFRFILLPPDWVLRFVEEKLQLVRRLPHYISLDRKTYGRYGLQPAGSAPPPLLPLTTLKETSPADVNNPLRTSTLRAHSLSKSSGSTVTPVPSAFMGPGRPAGSRSSSGANVKPKTSGGGTPLAASSPSLKGGSPNVTTNRDGPPAIPLATAHINVQNNAQTSHNSAGAPSAHPSAPTTPAARASPIPTSVAR